MSVYVTVSPTATWTNDLDSPRRAAWYFAGAQQMIGLGGHTANTADLGHRRYDQVAFPSAKVYFFDRGARHFTPRAVYWNYRDQKQPILYFDGVVRTTRTGAANPGWDWQRPNSPFAYSYLVDFTQPNFQWHPGRPAGEANGTVSFYGAFWATTRDGLAGRDFQ